MEIESFNMLFSQAKAAGFRLGGLNEGDAGFFYAWWKHKTGNGPEVKRRLPFNAALDAFLELKRIVDEDSAGAEDGLFG